MIRDGSVFSLPVIERALAYYWIDITEKLYIDYELAYLNPMDYNYLF